jgi:hypothetical protein
VTKTAVPNTSSLRTFPGHLTCILGDECLTKKARAEKQAEEARKKASASPDVPQASGYARRRKPPQKRDVQDVTLLSKRGPSEGVIVEHPSDSDEPSGSAAPVKRARVAPQHQTARQGPGGHQTTTRVILRDYPHAILPCGHFACPFMNLAPEDPTDKDAPREMTTCIAIHQARGCTGGRYTLERLTDLAARHSSFQSALNPNVVRLC